jgi:hypothetical protein
LTDNLATEAWANFRATHTQEKVRAIKARAGQIAAEHGDDIARYFLEASGIRQRTGPRDARGVKHAGADNPFWPYQEAVE